MMTLRSDRPRTSTPCQNDAAPSNTDRSFSLKRSRMNEREPSRPCARTGRPFAASGPASSEATALSVPKLVNKTNAPPSVCLIRFAIVGTTVWAFVRSRDKMFEFACHEGNHSMQGMLAGARQEQLLAVK